MRPKHVHELRVAPRNLRWEVSLDGVTRRMIDWLYSKERAVAHAYERAAELSRFSDGGIVIVIMRPDGTVEERHTVAAANERTLRAS